MTTSSPTDPVTPHPGREPLRLTLAEVESTSRVDGAWWPRSRDLHREGADLVDQFPASHGRISRLLFSRPDWDESSKDGRGVRSIRASRGIVKVGSFPSDDTHLMVLTMSSGRRLKLLVIPSDTAAPEAEQMLSTASAGATTDGDHPVPAGSIDHDRWDDETAAG